MKKKGFFLALLAFVFLSFLIFRSYFFKGQIPFPANLLVSYYSPWRFYDWEGYPNGPPNKPIGFDVLKLFYPYRKFTIEQLKSGQWPLWNPYNFSGNVHLATYQSAVFYPLNFLYFLMPLVDAWSWLVIIQPLLAGFFMYLFLTKIELSEKAAFFGSLVFAFSGWMIAWMEESLVIEHSALWLPLILYAVELNRKKITPLGCFLFVFGLTASILAGFTQLTLYLLVTVLAWIIFRYWPLKRKDLKKLSVLVLGFVFSFFISAAHLFPAIEAYLYSPRGVTDAKFLFDQYLMPPWHLITFLAPDFWGNTGAYNYFGGGFYHEKVIFIGLPAFLLVLLAFLAPKPNRVLNFFKKFSLITLALGFFPFGWLLYYSHLPLFSVMIPSRIFFLSTFGLSVLAAFGLEVFFQQVFDNKKWRQILIAIGIIFVLLWLFVFLSRIFLPKTKFGSVSLRNLILPTGFFLVSVLLIDFLQLKKKLPFLAQRTLATAKQISFWGLIILSLLSSFYFANKYLYFSERKFVFPEVAVISQLKAIAGFNRVWGYGEGYLEKNMNLYFGLYSPEGYDALFSQRYGELLHAQEERGRITGQITRTDADIKPAAEKEKEGVLDDPYRRKLLTLLGVKYIFEAKKEEAKAVMTEEERFPLPFFQPVWEDENFKIWDYQEALPRAFLVNDYLIETEKQKIADTLFDPDFDLKKKLILEEKPDLEMEKNDGEVTGKVEILDYQPLRIELASEAETPTLLFLSDNYFPGWLARVDGQESKILRADYSFRALALPAGKHQILFTYEPKVFTISLKISLLALFLFISWLFFVKMRLSQ